MTDPKPHILDSPKLTEEEKAELGEFIGKAIALAHEAGFSDGRNACSDYVRVQYQQMSFGNGNPPTQNFTNTWFKRQQIVGLQRIADLLREGQMR